MTHVVLTGFMAVGKTAVGKRLARKLDRSFIDTDHVIEQRAGMPVARIFEKRGEAAFRTLEREVVAGLDADPPAVIATGGGTFVDARNQDRLHELGIVVCLVTSLETVLERAGRGTKRPLAAGASREKLESLYNERMEAYRRADVLVETDGLSVEQSVGRVLKMIGPRLRSDAATERGVS